MTTHDADQLVQAAVTMLNAGDRAGARSLLVQALRINPRHEQATLWLSGTVDTPEQQRQILQRVLELNPHNRIAQRGLALLEEEVAHCPRELAPTAAEPWTPPEPLDAATLAALPIECAQCGALGYAGTAFCWRCHAPIHTCANCVFTPEPTCKELQQISDLDARNTCPWWRPKP